MKRFESFLPVIITCILSLGAYSCIQNNTKPYKPGHLPPFLKYDEKQPLYSLPMTDAAELELVVRKFKFTPVQTTHEKVYFYDSADLVERLIDFGYSPSKEEPYRALIKVARVGKRGKEAELRKLGIFVINRERDYWVVRGSLGQLNSLHRIGYQISKIDSAEPYVRFAVVTIPDKKTLRWLSRINVVINQATKHKEGYRVVIEAFDYQLDMIQDRGFTIKKLEPK